jgi:hypothetical protein
VSGAPQRSPPYDARSAAAAAAAVAAAVGQSWGPVAAWSSALLGVLPWPAPSLTDYQRVAEESEYGAW